mgnify:FL=1
MAGRQLGIVEVGCIRLLIIEDSATARAIIEQIVIQDPGAEIVGVAASSEQAKVLLRTLKPNVITLDLHMPGMGGLAFLDDFGGPRHAPIVVLSSSTTKGSDIARESIRRGAAACFDKAALTREAARFRQALRRVIAIHDRAATASVYG